MNPNRPETSQLGRETAYPDRYDAGLLFPIPRQSARDAIGIAGDALPFIGFDAWNAYELSWLDARGKPRVAVARITVPADSPNLIESKSFKLYLNSFNAERIASQAALAERLCQDLSDAAGAPVNLQFGLPPMAPIAADSHESIDDIEIDIDDYGPPNPAYLSISDAIVQQALSSHLLKSNCPVTGQPDWATVIIRYHGARIDPAGLLRYLVSFRNHREFHEQCVERIFIEIMQHCRPQQLSVEARYTRRGGLDINPWRATPGYPPPVAQRDLRQ